MNRRGPGERPGPRSDDSASAWRNSQKNTLAPARNPSRTGTMALNASDWLVCVSASRPHGAAPMSNPNDPNPNKPQEQPQQPTDRPPVDRSTFEFALPEGVESYSDIPPVPQPEEADSTFVNKAAVPPRPNTLRPATNTFDFLALPEAEMGPLSGPGLQNVAATPPPVGTTPRATTREQ